MELSHSPKQEPLIFITPIEQEQIDNWRPYSKICGFNPTDCVQTSLGFLNLIDENVGKQQSILHNYIKKGTRISEIVYLLEQKYTDSKFYVKEFDINENLYNNILSKIPLSHATLGLFANEDKNGHAVVIAKSNENSLVIIDPQYELMEPIRTYAEFMTNFANKYNYKNLLLFQYKSKRTPKKRTTKRKRSSNPIKKQSSYEKQTKKQRIVKSKKPVKTLRRDTKSRR